VAIRLKGCSDGMKGEKEREIFPVPCTRSGSKDIYIYVYIYIYTHIYIYFLYTYIYIIFLMNSLKVAPIAML
jgi:hypothetical protein